MDGMPLFPAPGITAPIGEDALMLWLRRGLAARHDATLAEALPAEWLRLIDPAGPPRSAT